VPAALAVILIVTAISLPGLSTGKWLGNAGGIATYSAGAVIIAAGIAAALTRGSATEMNPVPEFELDKLNFWPQIAFAFGGLELSAIMAGEIRDPQRTVRRAAWIGGASIAAFYIAGTMAMLALLPPERISPVTGLAQAGHAAQELFGMPSLGAWIALLITIGITGQLGAWMSGTARLPVVLGMDRLLPRSFSNVRGVLAVQSATCILLLIAANLGGNLRTGYQLLVDLTVITYFIPFAYMFLAAWRFGSRGAALAGLAVTLFALGFSFVPPYGAGSVWLFEVKLLGGLVLITALAKWCYQK
jgi:amino acid transporter